jgi:hypothetical protein
MEIGEQVERVIDPAGLAAFIDRLRSEGQLLDDLSANQYLEQLQAFLVDAANSHLEQYGIIGARAWTLVADLLFSAAIYE